MSLLPRFVLAIAATLSLLAGPAHAQKDLPARIAVPYPPGEENLHAHHHYREPAQSVEAQDLQVLIDYPQDETPWPEAAIVR